MGRYSGKTCRLLFMLVLTVVFFVAELVSGYLGNSIALLSDSFNMLSDLISLCVGLTAGYIARRAPGGSRATYGYVRAEVVGALSNAVFLTALCFTIFVEAVLRLGRPERIDDPELVLIVGALGLAVNVVGLLVFQDCTACFAHCGRRRHNPQQVAEGGTGGAFGGPQGATPIAPGPDSAVAPRVASLGRTAEKGVTVFSNVAGAFRLRSLGALPSSSFARFLPPLPTPSFFSSAFFKNPFPLQFRFNPLLRTHPIHHDSFDSPTISSFLLHSQAPFASMPFPPSLCAGVLIFLEISYYWATNSTPHPYPLTRCYLHFFLPLPLPILLSPWELRVWGWGWAPACLFLVLT